jgi:hypothetical protein
MKFDDLISFSLLKDLGRKRDGVAASFLRIFGDPDVPRDGLLMDLVDR